jgi:hypothetical protein
MPAGPIPLLYATHYWAYVVLHDNKNALTGSGAFIGRALASRARGGVSHL